MELTLFIIVMYALVTVVVYDYTHEEDEWI